jgi:endoglucanase
MKNQYKTIHRLFFAFLIMMSAGNVVYAQDQFGMGFAFEQNKRLGRGVNIIGYDPLWKDASKDDQRGWVQ